jgi:pilus assembly protein CpaE
MTIYLLTSEPSEKNDRIEKIEAKLSNVIPDLRKIEKIEDIAAEMRGKPDTKIVVIYVSPTLAGSAMDNFINVAGRYRDRIFFILVSDAISGDDYKRLVRSGGADWVAANGSFQEISELIYKQTSPPDRVPQPDIKSTIVSFLPCMGGVGNTTIALEIALRIKLAKTTRSWKTCYIDLDVQTSHVCDYLDIDPRFQISDIIEHPERLDDQLFGLFVSHHASGLDVFAAPRSKIDPCEIDAAVLDPFLEMVLEKYNYVIFDLPVSWFSWTIPILESSDAVILTGINTIPCLRQMRVTRDAVAATKVSSGIAIVMNRVKRQLLRRIERRAHVEHVFPNENIYYIHEHPDAVERVNTGTPAALAGAHAKEYAKLVSFCTRVRQPATREAAR